MIIDSKDCLDFGKLYNEDVSLQIIVDTALEKAATRLERFVIFKAVESFVTEQAIRTPTRARLGRLGPPPLPFAPFRSPGCTQTERLKTLRPGSLRLRVCTRGYLLT